MYKSFFNLKIAPFGSSPDPRFLYVMPQTREALASLEYGISARKGFIVLTGEVGTGKTTLLRRTLSSFQQRVVSCFVFNPRLDVLDFLEFVLSDFGLVPVNRTKSGMLLQLNRWLVDRFRQGDIPVIVVDEAQNLSWELLEEIRLLTNLETSSEKLVQIILSGQPEFEQRLRQPDLRQLRQRVALWCKTQPLSLDQTQAYIVQRLSVAGGRDDIFPTASMELIYRASGGIPRLINLICEHCLIFAYVEHRKEVLPELVATVLEDLALNNFADAGNPQNLSPRDNNSLSSSSFPSDPSSSLRSYEASLGKDK